MVLTRFCSARCLARSSQAILMSAFSDCSGKRASTRREPVRRAALAAMPPQKVLFVYPAFRNQVGNWVLIEWTAFGRVHAEKFLEREPAQVRRVENVDRQAVPNGNPS